MIKANHPFILDCIKKSGPEIIARRVYNVSTNKRVSHISNLTRMRIIRRKLKEIVWLKRLSIENLRSSKKGRYMKIDNRHIKMIKSLRFKMKFKFMTNLPELAWRNMYTRDQIYNFNLNRRPWWLIQIQILSNRGKRIRISIKICFIIMI